MPLIKHNPSDNKKVVKTIKVTKTTTTYTTKKNNIKCINYR